MYFTTLFLFCFLVNFFGHSSGVGVINGYSTRIQDFPFQVTVEVDRKPVCSGAIIGDKWIITARTCVPKNLTEVNRVRIRAGTSVLGQGGAFHTVSKMRRFVERETYFATSDADLGLIKVEAPFTYASTIEWSTPDVDGLPEGKDIMVSGWGIHKEPGNIFIQKSFGKILTNDECKSTYQDILNITSEMACIVPLSEQDNVCVGDVGAPISVNGLITAIVSNNEYCWTKHLPLVVTNVKGVGWFIVFTISEPILRFGEKSWS